MKKILCLSIVLCFILNAFCFTAFAADVFDATLIYDSVNQTISVSGIKTGGNTQIVKMYIMPKDVQVATTALINDGRVLFDFVRVDENDTFTFEMGFPERFKSGEYNAVITCADRKIVKGFLFLNIALAEETVTKINGATDLTVNSILSVGIEDFGADKDEYITNSSYIDKKTLLLRPITGYTVESFVQTYMQNLAMARIKSSEYLVSKAMEEYSTYLGITGYTELDESVKSMVDLLIMENDYATGDFPTFYFQQLALAEVKTAPSVYDMQENALEKAYYLGIKTDEYDKINNEYYEFQVFDELYSTRDSIMTVEDFAKNFNTIVAEKKRLANKQNGTGSGGGGGGGGGGSVTPSSKEQDYTVIEFSEPEKEPETTKPQVTETKLSDISGHWAENAIIELCDMELVRGYDDGNFYPDSNITRAEFAVIISRMLGLEGNTVSSFNDVGTTDWFYSDVNRLAAAGIINGFDGDFMPKANITRQDMAVIIYNVIKYKNVTLEKDINVFFDDDSDIADYAREKISALSSNKLMIGNGGKFFPRDNATRAEAVTLIHRLLNLNY